MNTNNFTIKNFRVFNEEGATFPLKPISIITGCNSSGKSSLVKSVFLVKSFLDQIREAQKDNKSVEIADYKIDFSKYPNNLLARFDNIIHKGSGSDKITIGYTVYSKMISKEVDVTMVFGSDAKDELNNAYLYSLTFAIDGEIFYHSSRNEDENTIFNLNLIKDAFIEYVEIEESQQLLMQAEYPKHTWIEEFSKYFGYKEISEEQVDEELKKIKSSLKKFNGNRCYDISALDKKGKTLISQVKSNISVLEWTKQNNSLFYIPVLEHLDTINKTEIASYINDNILNGIDDELLLYASQKIIEDFCKSDFNLLSEYFKDKEIQYHNEIKQERLFEIEMSNNFHLHRFVTSSEKRMAVLVSLGVMPSVSERSITNVEEYYEVIKQFYFEVIYFIIMRWNSIYTKDEINIHYDCDDMFPTYSHSLHKMFRLFVKDLMLEILTYEDFENMSYVSSSRAEVKRLYALENQDDFTNLLKQYFNNKRKKVNSEYEPNTFINNWIQEFGIGNSISIEVNSEGLGAQIKIEKRNGGNSRLLADEGYGITQLVSILLQIENSIISEKSTFKCASVPTEMLESFPQNFKKLIFGSNVEGITLIGRDEKSCPCTIAIEEPEIHLHPKYQSLLADMLVDAYKNYNIHFMVETHSEYLIRKLQLLVAKEEVGGEDVSILYVNSPEDVREENEFVRSITICKDGYLEGDFGPGFYDEAIKLSRQLI